MAVNIEFEAYKIAREIKKNGVQNVFYRNSVNEFGEPVENAETRLTVGTLKSLYHEQSGYVQVAVADGVQYRTKKLPMLMSLYEDIKYLNLKVGDYCVINGRKYTIINILNLYNWDILCDLSLEVFDNGSPAI